MVQLLDFKPHKLENMQCYICVKSLVGLHTYKEAGIVRTPTRREGWELKKWEAWEHTRREIEDAWITLHQMEQNVFSHPHRLGVILKEFLQHLADEMIRIRVIMEINQILEHLPDCPNQHQRSLRRLNWVEQRRDVKKLAAHTNELGDLLKVSKKAMDDISRAIKICVLDHPQFLQGASSLAAMLPPE